MQYDANGKNGRVYSSGLRNAVVIAMHPVTKQLWVTRNERDNIEPDHEDLPPEEIHILQDGGHYGWPCWGRPVDVLVHRDGSTLISDDAEGVIYRVFETGGR